MAGRRFSLRSARSTGATRANSAPAPESCPQRHGCPRPPLRPEVQDLGARPQDPTPFDGAGLYLEIAPSGGKWWRLKYRHGGKEKRISLGVYPEVTLKKARLKRDEARQLIADGGDPSSLKKAKRIAASVATGSSFEEVARAWVGKMKGIWSPKHTEVTLHRLETYVFPWHNRQPVGAITAPELLVTLRLIEDRGAVAAAPTSTASACRAGLARGSVPVVPAPALRCVVCGRPGRFVRAGPLRRLRLRQTDRAL